MYKGTGTPKDAASSDYVEDPEEEKGRSWPKAFKSLQTALFIAGPGSEIRVAEGAVFSFGR